MTTETMTKLEESLAKAQVAQAAKTSGDDATGAAVAPAPSPTKAAVTDARRASLARQIARLTGM